MFTALLGTRNFTSSSSHSTFTTTSSDCTCACTRTSLRLSSAGSSTWPCRKGRVAAPRKFAGRIDVFAPSASSSSRGVATAVAAALFTTTISL